VPRYRIEVIDRTYAAILAAKTPAERVAMMAAAHRSARTMIQARLGQLLPNANPAERRREFLHRLLGHGTD
jgi:hypothetical protein